jgi:hypothetical protein
MRHLLLAATMLSVALLITFGAASALEGAAVARENSVADEQLQAADRALPELKSAGANEHVTSLFR